jgi:TolA-binding protein
MAFLQRWLLIWFTLVLGSGQVFAASGRENRAYAAALGAFQDAMWSRAETEFAQFAQKYPKSDRVAEAVLLQAEAEFKQEKFPQAIALLQARKAAAGILTDQYVYWMGEAQFQNGDYSAAAETFVSLTRDFPESSLRLRVVVEAAAALAQTNEWARVVSLLEETNSVFQRAAQMDPGNELVSRGQLLLARAKLAQTDFIGAAVVLGALNSQMLPPKLDWRRMYLLYQIKLAAGDTDAALAATTNLLQIARLESDDEAAANLAESVALRAGLFEQLNRPGDADAAYQENLATNVPAEKQKQAILKIAELAIARKQYSDAEESLKKFLAQFPGSPAADLAWLTLGELQLKDYVTQPAATNQLTAARERFDQFFRAFPNSPLMGKAYLDRGWCGWRAWLAGSTINSLTDSLTNFAAAAQKLPLSEDLAVARFKMGDALFALTNYAGALENYSAVIDIYTNFPAVGRSLGNQALYQSLRASLELTNLADAEAVMRRILDLSPAGDLNGASLLLVGEELSDSGQPAAARSLFEKFQEQAPHSPLRPEVELAIARTYEHERNWPAAIGKYSDWLNVFPTNALLRPQAEYALALADYQAGNKTNAFLRFTNFVARFPTDNLAPLAQWWVADHFFNDGDFMDAEKNFQLFFQNFPTNGLVYQARMMAGRAAMGRLGYTDAIRYFTSLTSDTNCPPDLNAKALFAYGSALMQGGATETNNPSANFERAMSVFSRICQLYPTNELGALAWGEIGDCDLQLAAYDAATNAYAQVIASPFVDISARSQAQIGFGIALEKKAALATGSDQTALLKLALDNYLAVFDTRFGENDPFWVKKAGLQALPLMDLPALSGVADPGKFIDDMETLFPQAKDSLEKKRAALPPKNN